MSTYTNAQLDNPATLYADAADFIDAMIDAGRFSPAARTMPLQRVINEYNDVNGYADGDEGFMGLPFTVAHFHIAGIMAHDAGVDLRTTSAPLFIEFTDMDPRRPDAIRAADAIHDGYHAAAALEGAAIGIG